MIQLFLVYALAVGSITAAPQFIDFSNGNVGVNFAGYSASAGLGGLLTGNAADGGLSASAGTPFGQRAVAGLGGGVNGNNAGGGLYAGAQANDNVGASAVLAGSTGGQNRGIIGTEAHSNGNTITRTLIQDAPATTVQKVTTVQKIKPPKKYITQTNIASPVVEQRSFVEVPASSVTVVKTFSPHRVRRLKHSRPAVRRVGLFKQISYVPLVSQRFGGEEQGRVADTATTYKTVQKNYNYPVVTKEVTYNPIQYLNIPIGILKSIQDSLQPIGYTKQVSILG